MEVQELGKGKLNNERVEPCPKDKVDPILDAFRHFEMIDWNSNTMHDFIYPYKVIDPEWTEIEYSRRGALPGKTSRIEAG